MMIDTNATTSNSEYLDNSYIISMMLLRGLVVVVVVVASMYRQCYEIHMQQLWLRGWKTVVVVVDVKRGIPIPTTTTTTTAVRFVIVMDSNRYLSSLHYYDIRSL